MSGQALPSLDVQEQIVRIDRAIAETHKLQNESDKFAAEARKMRRDYSLSPLLAAMAVIGGMAGILALALRLIGKG